MITIEKGISINSAHKTTVREFIDAMRQMEMGDSFVTSRPYEDFRRAAKAVGIFIEARSIYENDMKVAWRVWRVETPSRKAIAVAKSAKTRRKPYRILNIKRTTPSQSSPGSRQ